MLQQGQKAHRLTALRPQWTLQDHCHRILGTFTLFKDKCIVNFVSPTVDMCAASLLPQPKVGSPSPAGRHATNEIKCLSGWCRIT